MGYRIKKTVEIELCLSVHQAHFLKVILQNPSEDSSPEERIDYEDIFNLLPRFDELAILNGEQDPDFNDYS